STYGGNPLACAVGEAVMAEVNNEAFLAHVQDMALYFRQHLTRLLEENSDMFEDVRGRGLMVGLKCKRPNTDLVAALRDEKLLSIGAGDNVLRILPPLNVTQDEINIAVTALEQACAKLRAGD
ncbi:aminotransferase class III-fold pyridoxal phosphate-dependent enzyme, partial [Alphaproteobacteria bacterium]|nr:aminotransferase class III-fold pyridoxal phosphate-dependent enzyme [Alphaproteobacteria bacterium]